ncbi:ribosome assembly factor SBDS [Staphylothermus hellenicus]|uniref:Ribosome maturation protein SBDS-like protein n=1 Tax=Staphylothermus hellenicus (strain DSM 12710 / JCM 10830 / BK20S6-10-b1 / P8) TaxID=591019 RepID=D7DAA3_STAHD|nr:ribosome assembly factor SBDS [Staphylothermus hellenicus]ADI32699.1 Ribosome maturation protein SBDS-like protein [Staphylothermus hellenicus DSM 12710]
MPEKHVIARYEAKGHKFEILVNPDLALKVKEGKTVNIDELLVGDYVYKDARKGLKASPESLRAVFGTDDIKKVALEIIKRGEIHLTAEQRRRIIENKRRQIISLIARNAIDPKTKLPIPPKRIELAMEQARVSIDPFKSPKSQIEEIVSKIARIIPIKIAKAYIAVKVPPQFSGKVYKVLSSIGEIKKSNWLNDGSLLVEIEIPAGMQEELIERINKVTHGSANIKVLYVR